MESSLAQRAIDCALRGDWVGAVTLNQDILKLTPDDLDALNRLTLAYMQTGEEKKAKDTNTQVLNLDPGNTIADRLCEKLKSYKKPNGDDTARIAPTTFLEEPGKTKIVDLLYISDKDNLNHLTPGEVVCLSPHAHRVSVCTTKNKYLGRLPDDLAARLRKLIKLGNEYQAIIKTATDKGVRVFIKETKKAAAAKDFISFPSEKIEYITFTPPNLVHKDSPVTEQTESQV